MAKSGRPKKEDGEQNTKQIRVAPDIADWLSDLALVHPKTTAQILDPLIREEIRDLHAKYLPEIEAAKAAEARRVTALQKVRELAAQKASQEAESPTDKPKKPKTGQ